MNILHSSRHDNWHTPPEILSLVREVLGPIELDPASSDEANKTVQAEMIFTKESDGLASAWPAHKTVFLNPPGGKLGNKSYAALFWAKLMHYRNHYGLKHAIYMGFSIEQLAISQNYHSEKMLDFPFCVPRQRIAFVDPLAPKKQQPSHSNIIVYVPGTINQMHKFRQVFATLGATR